MKKNSFLSPPFISFGTFITVSFLFLITACQSNDTTTPTQAVDLITTFEKSEGTETATYQETIAYYTKLDRTFSSISVQEIGMTDSGKPLHLITYNPEGEFNFETIRKNKNIILINNGIHPGEPDGIDATMLFMRDLAQDSIPTPKNTVVAAIAIYNIGGALNRNSTTRTDQNGPKAYGFRGNGQNYDLNRDFIKADTKNARSFYEVFHLVKPTFYVEPHVSNGADYQYILTHLLTQHNRLGGKLGRYLHENFRGKLEKRIQEKGWDITPYVSAFGRTPDTGFRQFLDTPRYSTGYTALWNTLGMMIETHKLKPYKQRVWGTYAILRSTLQILEKDGDKIAKLQKENTDFYRNKTTYSLNYVVDSSKVSYLNFKGYAGQMVPSKVTGLPRLKYNREKPYTKKVPYYNDYKPTAKVVIPKAYIIPQTWWPVINRLKWNHIDMHPLEKDTTLLVGTYRIKDYKTVNRAYEGHYLHYATQVARSQKKIEFRKGDMVIPTNQPGIRYIIETLEPIAKDSFFNWNFFDTVLQQKEHFSPYVFEETAYKFLENHPTIKAQFETKRKTDKSFRNNSYMQLAWIFRHSPYYEKAHLQYPVYRVAKKN